MAQEDAGIVLTKNAHWQPDHLLVIEAENTADYMLNLHVTFRGTGNEVSVCIGIFPHWPCTVPIPLSITDGKTLFPERTPGRFKATVKGANLRFEDLEEIEVSPSPCGGADVMFGKIAVEPAMPASFTMPREPLVDELHQWRARDWPGKAHTIEDMRAALENELAGHAPAYPDDWSHYGGWKEMTFRASGFFRTEHDGRRWWLVDPEGHAFWSIGVDCVRTETSANVAGIETVFSPPLPSAAHAPHLWSTRGNARLFSAMEHNLERALGSEWKRKWLELTKRRLRRYRVNTIANWSDRALHGCCGVPYVFTMASFPKTTPAIFRDFPDVYSEEYERNSNAFAGQLAAIRDDRNVIGYFMTNEPQWAFVGGFDIGAQLLMADAPFASLAVFIEDLKRKYATIDALNRVWGSTFASFDELRRKHDPRTFPGRKDDTTAFTRKAV